MDVGDTTLAAMADKTFNFNGEGKDTETNIVRRSL